MNLIVAVDNNNCIGKDNQLAYRISSDLKNFKELTTNKVVIYGRKTLETFPNKKPLKNRTNIILSRNKDLIIEGAIVKNSIDDVFDEIKKYDTKDIFIIGGEEIYKLFFDYCDTCYLTSINAECDGNKFFPELNIEEWKTPGVTIHSENNLDYTYGIFTRKKNVKPIF